MSKRRVSYIFLLQISQVFSPFPLPPFLWNHSKLGEPWQPWQRWNPAFGLSSWHLKWMALSMSQLNLRHQRSRRRIFSNSHANPLFEQGPSKESISRLGAGTVRVFIIFSARIGSLSFPHLPVFPHFCFLILFFTPTTPLQTATIYVINSWK